MLMVFLVSLHYVFVHVDDKSSTKNIDTWRIESGQGHTREFNLDNDEIGLGFYKLEAQLSELRFDINNSIVTNSLTMHRIETLTKTFVALEASGLSADTRYWLANVLEEGQALSLMGLVKRFKSYKTRLHQLDKQKVTDISALLARQNAIEQLQASLFDTDTISYVFEASNRNVRYLLARQAINQSKTLTNVQKNERLKKLKAEYESFLFNLKTGQTNNAL